MPVNYELNSNGVYGIQNGVYQDTLSTIVDDFEDGDIAEYGGSTSNYSVDNTSPVFNGSYSIKSTVSSGGSAKLHSTSGLNAYPAQGDLFRCGVNLVSNATEHRTSIRFGVPSGSPSAQGYYAQIRGDTSEIRLFKDDGSFAELAASAFTPSGSKWYEIEVDWQSDGTIAISVIDPSDGSSLASLSATDTTFSSGGIGFGNNPASGTTDAAFDHFRIL